MTKTLKDRVPESNQQLYMKFGMSKFAHKHPDNTDPFKFKDVFVGESILEDLGRGQRFANQIELELRAKADAQAKAEEEHRARAEAALKEKEERENSKDEDKDKDKDK